MRCSPSPLPATVITIAALSLLAAGCGAGSSRTTATTTAQSGTLAYAQCMHSHGVPNFPDPLSTGEIPKDKLVPLVGTSHFQTARSACQHVMPASGLGPRGPVVPTRTRLADALAFARCIRARGFHSFPDPTNQGELTPQMVTAAGIDLHQPDLLRAGLACVTVTHGLLTPAAIERAVNGG